AVTLCETGSIVTPGGAWGPNNTILFQSVTGVFQEVPASGGAPRRVTVVSKRTFWFWPEFLLDGGAIVFAASPTRNSFPTTGSIAAAVLSGAGAEKDLIPGGIAPHLAATGDLVYAQNGTLMAVPFDSKRLALAGSPAPVLEGVRTSPYGA